MNVSPLDLRQQKFNTALRGYDKVEVTAFLVAAADDYETALALCRALGRDPVERVTELLAQSGDASRAAAAQAASVRRLPTYEETGKKRRLTPLIVVAAAIAVVGAGIAGYLLRGGQADPQPEVPTTVPRKTDPGIGTTDMEKRIHDLVGTLGGAIPATSLARGFHVPDLGVRMAFLTAEQSASTLGAMPQGAVVMEVESGRPMAKAGIHVGDVVLSIAGKKITSEDDLRQAIFKIGPGKTQYSYRRGGDTKTRNDIGLAVGLSFLQTSYEKRQTAARRNHGEAKEDRGQAQGDGKSGCIQTYAVPVCSRK